MILITGLTGTSGSAFYKVLCENGFSEPIRVVVRETTDLSMFKDSSLELEFVTGDIEDLEFMKKAVKDVRLVFHIAAKEKAKQVVEAICSAPQKPSAYLVSSTIVYSNYYRTLYLKESEKEFRRAFEENGIRYIFIRPTMIFGTPNDKNISVFSRWIKKYRYFPIVRKGEANIQPVHRDDLANAYYAVLSNFDNLKETDYIVSGKEEMTLISMFNTIKDVLGTKTSFVNIPLPIASAAVRLVFILTFGRVDYREKLDRLTEDRAFPHDVITKELGYDPLSFEERLRQAIDEFKDYV